MTDTQSGVTLPVLPLDDDVVLPGMVVPVDISDSEVRSAVEAAQAVGDGAAKPPGIRSASKPRVLIVPRVDGSYAGVGTVAVIEQVGRTSDGEPAAVLRGTARARVGSGTTGPGAALWVSVAVHEEKTPEGGHPGRVQELAREYKTLLTTYLQKRGAWQILDGVQQLDDPSRLADRGGYSPFLKTAQKLRLLESYDVSERLGDLIEWTREYLAELDVTETINKDVQEGVDKQQREFLLRRQMEAVRKELNELSGKPGSEEEDYRERVETADLPEHVRTAALAEVDKLERAGDSSPEAGWIRTWLDTSSTCPGTSAPTTPTTSRARAGCSTPTTRDSTTSRSASWSTWRCASAARTRGSASSAAAAAVPCSPWSARPASARPRWANRWRAPWGGRSPGSRSAASGTRRRSAATGAPTSARCPAGSSAPSRRPVR